MARVARVEAFAPDEIATIPAMNRVVRRCFLMGSDELTGKNYDHRKAWVEKELKRLAADFGIDLLSFAVLSNHFHLILRSRPDVVATWDDTEVARRRLMLCPGRKRASGSPADPSEPEVNSIRFDEDKLTTNRRRLSDISWWMRLLCQRIAQRAKTKLRASFGKIDIVQCELLSALPNLKSSISVLSRSHYEQPAKNGLAQGGCTLTRHKAK